MVAFVIVVIGILVVWLFLLFDILPKILRPRSIYFQSPGIERHFSPRARMFSTSATSPIAPYRGEYVMECFKLNVGMEDFFTQAALAVENYVCRRDGKKRNAPVSRAGPYWGVILLYVGEEGTILQKSVDLKDVPLACVFLRQFGFNSLDCECRLYSADFKPMKRREPLKAPRLLKTSWSHGLPVFWALTSRSVFLTPNRDDEAYIPQDASISVRCKSSRTARSGTCTA